LLNKVADSFAKILEPTKEKMAFLMMNFALPQWMARRVSLVLKRAKVTSHCYRPDYVKGEAAA
jgi:hypothetical protein